MSDKKIAWGIGALKLLFFILCIIALMIVAIVMSPWKQWIAGQLEALLKGQGFENPSLSIGAVSLNTINLSDITFGDDESLALRDINIHYTPVELLHGGIRDLKLNGLQISIVHGAEGWQVRGFQAKSHGDSYSLITSAIPLTRKTVDGLPFDALSIDKSHVTISGDGWNVDVPFSFLWQDELSIASLNTRFKYNKIQIEIEEADVMAQLKEDDSGWKGTWSARGMSMSSMFAFDVEGMFTLDAQGISLSGRAIAKDGSGVKGELSFSYEYADPQNMLFTLNNISMPWGDGTLSVKKVSIPIMGKTELTFPVRVERVSIDDLMQLITGEHVRATGTLSGMLPVIVSRGGLVSLGSGTLKADKKGKLSLPQNVITGQGAQIELTRDILENYHYDDLTIGVKKEDRDKISVLLALKGNNPDMYNGRAVHLNVRLGGDVLDFIRSNVMMIMQPETLFDQDLK